MSKLPTLPEPDAIRTYGNPYVDGYTQAYGQQCRDVALEEAAKAVTVEIGNDDYTTRIEAAKAIRSLK